MPATSIRGKFLETAAAVLGSAPGVAFATDLKRGIETARPGHFPLCWVRPGADTRGRMDAVGGGPDDTDIDAQGFVWVGSESHSPAEFEDFLQGIITHLFANSETFRTAGIAIDDIRIDQEPEFSFELPYETGLIRIDYGGC